MKLIITIVLSFFSLLFCQSNERKEKLPPAVYANKSEERIIIDGILNENVWKFQSVSTFIQSDPVEGAVPSEKTECWVAYDEDNIYVAAKLYDSTPDLITKRIARHDYMSETDYFSVTFDSYYDKRTGFYFEGNPSGSKSDGIFFNDSWSDNSWNAIWDYSAKIDNEGWTVEMKIPFSQLRFNNSDDMIWGINFGRFIQRKNELIYYSLIPKVESGFISFCADLKGLKGIKPKQRLEILPYAVSKAQYLVHDEKDPFYKKNQYWASIGADFKVGLGSNLTLDGTINPDFGQVEVDPAVVNLTAFETYFSEKRPFFIEGSSIFAFGVGGANSNWGFNFSVPEFFYSRRIGKSPGGSVSHYGYQDYPNQTRILSAAKLSGKFENDWSVGFLSAITERTFAKVDSSGVIFEDEVEPLSFYGLARIQKESDKGFSSLGMILTYTKRDLRTNNLKDVYSNYALTFGTDGFTHLDEDRNYVLTAFLAGSYVKGSNNYLNNLQKSPNRYFQRPDAKFLKLDSNRTDLSGFITRLTLNKQKGNFYMNAALGIITPGFESNDIGFMFSADKINAHIVLGYKWFETEGIFKHKQIFASFYRTYNFDGYKTADGIYTMGSIEFTNYYGLNFSGSYCPQYYSVSHTRGGPIALRPAEIGFDLSGFTDDRESLVFDLGTFFYGDAKGGGYNGLYASAGIKLNNAVDFSISPRYEYNFESFQWVDKFQDKNATETFGNRYVFAKISHKTFSFEFRLNWSLTPDLSIQLYLQQLFTAGTYSNFKELKNPNSLDYKIYGTENSKISYNETDKKYGVIPDTKNLDQHFEFDNPDFNDKSVRGSLVLRWEYLPGSTLFFVWTRDQNNSDNPGVLSIRKDFRDLWNAQPNNIFLVKLNYWFNAF